jgi:hypothetical protein
MAATVNIILAINFILTGPEYADADPNEMRFKHAACFDVGLECGGWGRIVLEIKVEDSKKV